MSNVEPSNPCAPVKLESTILQDLYRYWSKVAGERKVITRREVDPTGMGPQVLPWVILFDIEREPRRYRYRLMGTRMTEFIGRDLTGEYLDEQPGLGPVLPDLQEFYGTVAISACPGRHEGDFVGADGHRTRAERLAIPLGPAEDEIDCLLAGFAFPDKEPD